MTNMNLIQKLNYYQERAIRELYYVESQKDGVGCIGLTTVNLIAILQTKLTRSSLEQKLKNTCTSG